MELFLFPAWRAQPAGAGLAGRFVSRLCAALLFLAAGDFVQAEGTNSPPVPAVVDMATPPLMTGTFYEIGSDRHKMLFHYRRAATRNGATIQVVQTFAGPDGTVLCRENICYQNNQLVSYVLEDLRANIHGSIAVENNPKKPERQRLALRFSEDRRSGVKVRKATENMEPNTLISDTIYPYILTHWDELMGDESVKFRFISLDPPRTFAFRLVKDSELEWQGRPVVRVKMEAVNFLVAHFIDPIYFIIEKAPPHRIFSYIGRTTPRQLVDGEWKPTDAEAVFDWP